MYVLDVTTGATFRLGVWRVIGTVSGAVVGYVVCVMRCCDVTLLLANGMAFRAI
jgi:hypothetical protein